MLTPQHNQTTTNHTTQNHYNNQTKGGGKEEEKNNTPPHPQKNSYQNPNNDMKVIYRRGGPGRWVSPAAVDSQGRPHPRTQAPCKRQQLPQTAATPGTQPLPTSSTCTSLGLGATRTHDTTTNTPHDNTNNTQRTKPPNHKPKDRRHTRHPAKQTQTTPNSFGFVVVFVLVGLWLLVCLVVLVCVCCCLVVLLSCCLVGGCVMLVLSWDSLWSERCVLLEEGIFEMSDREWCDALDAIEERLFVFDSVRWLRVLEVENV
jgi:hypothetical protein